MPSLNVIRPDVGQIVGVTYGKAAKKNGGEQTVIKSLTTNKGKIINLKLLATSDSCWLFRTTNQDPNYVFKVRAVKAGNEGHVLEETQREKDNLIKWEDNFDSEVIKLENYALTNSIDLLGPPSGGICQNLIFITQPFIPGVPAADVLEEIFKDIAFNLQEYETLKEIGSSKDMLEYQKMALQGMLAAFNILGDMLKILDEFHVKTGLVHGDAWARNIMLEKTKQGTYIARLIDFDGSFSNGTSQQEYLQMLVANKHLDLQTILSRLVNLPSNYSNDEGASALFKKLTADLPPGANIYGQEIISSSLLCDIPRVGQNLLEETSLTIAADLHSMVASFVQYGLIDSEVVPNLAKIDPENASPMQLIAAEFITWATINCCNSPFFIKEVSNRGLIHEALEQKEVKLGDAAYKFSEDDAEAIIDMLSKILLTHRVLSGKIEFKEEDDKIKKFLRMQIHAELRECAVIKNRFALINILENILKSAGMREVHKSLSRSLLVEITRDCLFASYSQFPNPPSAQTRVSISEAIKYVDQLNVGIKKQIDAVQHLLHLNAITNAAEKSSGQRKMKRKFSDDLKLEFPSLQQRKQMQAAEIVKSFARLEQQRTQKLETIKSGTGETIKERQARLANFERNKKVAEEAQKQQRLQQIRNTITTARSTTEPLGKEKDRSSIAKSNTDIPSETLQPTDHHRRT